MENLLIKAQNELYFVPYINFNASTGICEIAGKSYLENTTRFYEPINKWVEDYALCSKQIEFNFKLVYFNTSSSKRILDILLLLRNFQIKGGDVTVNWYFEKGDYDAEEEITDFMIESKLSINLINFTEEELNRLQ